MTQNTVRIVSAGIAIAAVAVITLAHDSRHPEGLTDPSVPPAYDVFRPGDGRSEGNTDDKTF